MAVERGEMLNCMNQRHFSGGGDTSTEGPKGDFSRGISQALETMYRKC